MDMYKILKEYTEIPGPVGHEKRVQQRFMKDLAPYTDEVELTNVGNVVAHIPGEGRKVVIFGHADEVAYFVLSITDDGFLHLSKGRSGYVWYPYSLVGQKALVVGDKGDVRGAFISTSGHLLNHKEREQPLDLWNVYVDKLDKEIQQKWIYQPLADVVHRVSAVLFGHTVREKFRELIHALGLGEGRWFSWRAAAASILLVCLLLLLAFSFVP